MSLLKLLGLRALPRLAQAGTAARQAPARVRPARSDAFLKELAQWPQQAHRHWKRLSDGERMMVRMMMGERYGQDFGDAFMKATQSGATTESRHYGPGFPDHTEEWFKQRGYRLATRDALNDWWVHPSGHMITADRGMAWNQIGKPGSGPAGASKPVKLDPAEQALRDDVKKAEAEKQRLLGLRKALLARKAARWKPDYATQFDSYENGLEAFSNTLSAMLVRAQAARERLVARKADMKSFDEDLRKLIAIDEWLADMLGADLKALEPTTGVVDPPPDDFPEPPAEPIDYSGKGQP